jgi:hypothetical protein
MSPKDACLLNDPELERWKRLVLLRNRIIGYVVFYPLFGLWWAFCVGTVVYPPPCFPPLIV